MLTASKEFRLRGVDYRPGTVIPEAEWLATPEQNRRAMVRQRFVRSPDLAPSRAELRARQTASPVQAEVTPSSPTAPGARPTGRRARREH